jgi:hypothetical protein
LEAVREIYPKAKLDEGESLMKGREGGELSYG